MKTIPEQIAELEALSEKARSLRHEDALYADYEESERALISASQSFVQMHLPAIKRLAQGSGEPVAWLHQVTTGDGEPDQALSFAADSFPLEGVVGYRSLSSVPLYTHPPQAQAVVTESMVEAALHAWDEKEWDERVCMRAALTAALNAQARDAIAAMREG